MKTTMFSLFFSLLAFSLPAQILDQGNLIMGAKLGLSASDSKVTNTVGNEEEKGEGPSAVQLNIAPNIGYFVLDNFVVGMGMDYTFSVIEEPNRDRTEDSDLLFGPFLRYYFPIGKDMAIFMETDFGFGNATDQQYIGEEIESVQTTITAVGLGPGFTIFSSDAIGIEAVFKYNYSSSSFKTKSGGVETKTTTDTNQFDISIGLQFYFAGMRRIGG
jgi:hypothetical protein